MTEGRPFGRRLFLTGVGAGVAAVVAGGRLLPDIALPWSCGGWRIYNVAARMPSPADFRLRVDGLVERPLDLGLADLLDLPHVEQRSDFECVTGWKVSGVRWRGVRLGELLERAGATSAGTHLTFHSRDGVYTDSLSLASAHLGDTMLATGMDGRPLPRRHGGPARLVVPTMYGYKSVKWVGRVEVADREVVGYWEQRGYARDARIDKDPARAYTGRRRDVPGTGWSVEAPPGWTWRPIPGGGVLLRRAGAARVEASVLVARRADRATRDTTRDLLTGIQRAGLTGARYSTVDAGDLQGDVLEAEDGSGQRFLFAFLPAGRAVLQVQGQAPVDGFARWRPWFEQLAGSARR